MGWSDCGDDSKGRPIGYGQEATCDHPECEAEIDRGLAYACGGMHGNDDGCEGYFCGDHESKHDCDCVCGGDAAWDAGKHGWPCPNHWINDDDDEPSRLPEPVGCGHAKGRSVVLFDPCVSEEQLQAMRDGLPDDSKLDLVRLESSGDALKTELSVHLRETVVVVLPKARAMRDIRLSMFGVRVDTFKPEVFVAGAEPVEAPSCRPGLVMTDDEPDAVRFGSATTGRRDLVLAKEQRIAETSWKAAGDFMQGFVKAYRDSAEASARKARRKARKAKRRRRINRRGHR